MGKLFKADETMKKYWDNNDRFSDLFNAVFFDGMEVVKASELDERDTESSVLVRGMKTTVKGSRDLIKIRKKLVGKNVELTILALENQEHINYAMPLRVMGYDYVRYKKQYNKLASMRKKEEGLDSDEFVSKMRREDRLNAVFTIVIYYGEKPWNGPRLLSEMLHVPEEFKGLLSDYQMNLIEVRDCDLKFKNNDNQDMLFLLDLFLNPSANDDETIEIAKEYTTKRNTDSDVIEAVVSATKADLEIEEEEVHDMCTFFDRISKNYEANGIEKGIEKGREEGLEKGIKEFVGVLFECNISKQQIVNKLSLRFNISNEEAAEYVEKYSVKENIEV